MNPRIAVFLQPQHAEYDQIRNAALEAEKIGADAVVGVSFSTSVMSQGAAELMAFGTAVIVEDI